MSELFERLVRDHHATVWRSAWRVVRDADDASDVTQEVFAQLLRRGGEVAAAESPEKWLRWLAVKTALAHLRGARHRKEREERHAMERPERSDDREPAQRELAAAVRACVAALPDELRLATVLRFQEGLTFAQVGDCLGVAEPTAFERVKKAVAELRTRLAKLGHARVLAELEPWLARDEAVTVPTGLATSLLALAKGGAVAGAATASAAGAATAAAGKPLVAIAAAILITVAGGGWLVKSFTERPTITTSHEVGVATTEEGDANLAAAADGAPVAATRTEAPRDATPPAAPAAATHGKRRPARDFLGDSLGVPSAPSEAWEGRDVAVGTLTGVVVDDQGRRIAGATIDATSGDGAGKGWQWQARTSSDANGCFALEVAVVVEEEQRYYLTLNHVDHFSHRTDALRVRADATCDAGTLALRRITTDRAGDYVLAVHLRDADGHPVEGAWVRIARVLDETGDVLVGKEQGTASAKSDATGTATLAGTRIGRKHLTVEAHHLGLSSSEQFTDVRFTGFQELDVVLPRTLAIRGRLVFPAGTDVEGESTGRLYEIAPAPEGQPSAIDLVRKQHEGASYTRVGGCRVTATPMEKGRSPGDAIDAKLAADGSFTIEGVVAGDWRVAYSGRFAEAARFDVAAGSDDVVLTLKERDDPRPLGDHLAEIHARAVDAATGAPVDVAWDLDLVPTDDEAIVRRDCWPRMTSPPMPFQTMVQQEYELVPIDGKTMARPLDPFAHAARGAAELHSTGLEAGCYVAVARADGYANGLSRPLRLARDTIVADLVVTLTRPASVRGRVVDADGKPLAGAIVVAGGDGESFAAFLADCEKERAAGATADRLWGVHAVACDADGRFALAGLHPEVAWALGLLAKGHEPTRATAITLEAGGTLDVGDVTLR